MNNAQILRMLDIATGESDFPLIAICQSALAGSEADRELAAFIADERRYFADRCPHCGEGDLQARTANGDPCCLWDLEMIEGAKALAATDHDHSDAWMQEAMDLAGGDVF
jgi:hypothetical protein